MTKAFLLLLTLSFIGCANSMQKKMSDPVILFVKAKSALSETDLDKKLRERYPKFKEVPGLVQKVYGKNKKNGQVCGIYFFESKKALQNFAQSDLAKSIAKAYKVTEISKDVFEVLYSLRPENGPVDR